MDEDELNERMSRRFSDRDEDADTDSEAETSQNDMSSSTSQTEGGERKAQSAQNVKKEWNVRSFYLDDDLDAELTTAFKRLDLELSEADAGVDLKKTRHFYPLVVALGLERLEELERTEVTERLDGEESV